MSENKNGGPAFPSDRRGEVGMSLRDYFAAKAMRATLVNANPLASGVASHRSDSGLLECASEFYRMADATLKAREQ